MSNMKFRITSAEVSMANQSLGLSNLNIVNVQLCKVKLFDTITPKQMAKCQKRDTQLAYIYECVANNSKPKLTAIHRIRSKPARRLLLQYNQTLINTGVFCITDTFQGDDEIQQIILPQCFRDRVLKSLHDNNSHQGLQCVTDLLHVRVYWPTMFMQMLTTGLLSAKGVLFLKETIMSQKQSRVVW